MKEQQQQRKDSEEIPLMQGTEGNLEQFHNSLREKQHITSVKQQKDAIFVLP